MNTIKNILKYYFYGNATSLFVISIIHLYSVIFEPYFIYAEWGTIFQTIMISGISFGIAFWAFDKI
jgi:hypothetical protein